MKNWTKTERLVVYVAFVAAITGWTILFQMLDYSLWKAFPPYVLIYTAGYVRGMLEERG